MTKTIFVNPQTIKSIEQSVAQMLSDWPETTIQEWQLWQMIATIDLGAAEITRYAKADDGRVGIRVGNWNTMPDPGHAYGGFYRMEKGQQLGWAVYAHKDNPEAMHDSAARYGFWVYWEDQPMEWGWSLQAQFYTEREAQEALKKARTKLTRKRIRSEQIFCSDRSGMWCIKIETTNPRKIRGFNRLERRIPKGV